MRSLYRQFNVVVLILMLGILPHMLRAQAPISGTVNDEKKQPLPGVSVLINGTTRGTTTGIDGRFDLAASSGEVLEFHFVGYATQKVTIGEQKMLNITLQPDVRELGEVVVTALGVKKETRKIGYSVQEVSGEDLIRARDPNPISGLTGKVAGLSVGPSAELLRAPNVSIRGNTVSL